MAQNTVEKMWTSRQLDDPLRMARRLTASVMGNGTFAEVYRFNEYEPITASGGTGFASLLVQKEPHESEGLIMKVLKEEFFGNQQVAQTIFGNEVKACLQAEAAGVRGTARVKYFTDKLTRDCDGNQKRKAIFMIDEGRYTLSSCRITPPPPGVITGALRFSQQDAEAFAFQGTAIIVNLHTRAHMTHNDVKPTNFVVKPDCGAQHEEMTGSTYGFTLVDFGCATNNDENGETCMPQTNTQGYMDPLALRSHVDFENGVGCGRHHGFRTDMYALGVTVAELCGGSVNHLRGLQGKKPENPDLHDLLIHLTTLRESDRWGVDQVLRCNFMQNFAKKYPRAMGEAGLTAEGAASATPPVIIPASSATPSASPAAASPSEGTAAAGLAEGNDAPAEAGTLTAGLDTPCPPENAPPGPEEVGAAADGVDTAGCTMGGPSPEGWGSSLFGSYGRAHLHSVFGYASPPSEEAGATRASGGWCLDAHPMQAMGSALAGGGLGTGAGGAFMGGGGGESVLGARIPGYDNAPEGFEDCIDLNADRKSQGGAGVSAASTRGGSIYGTGQGAPRLLGVPMHSFTAERGAASLSVAGGGGVETDAAQPATGDETADGTRKKRGREPEAVEATAKAETEAGDAPTKRLKTSAGTKIANAGGASTETLRLPACGIERRPKRKHEDEVNEGDGTEDDGVNKDDGKEGGGGNALPSTWSREEGEPPRKRIRVGVPGRQAA